ncbi:MAG: DUF1614 domain-containing protein [Nitrospirota bacterium]
MRLLGFLPLLLFLLLLALLPFVFGELFSTALMKLHLDPRAALLGILIGSAINIPIRRLVRGEDVLGEPPMLFGLSGWWPRLQRAPRETIIAVNAGGCLIPLGLALYETLFLVIEDPVALWGLLVAVLLNTFACYWMARPIEGIGIAMPGLMPALGAVAMAPEHAAPVAFVAGVLGPLIGADLLHLRDMEKIATGVASIGGAGTFDGIVLSGIVAAYLA